MSVLSHLTPSGKKRKRVGRGGSRGGTSGKGHKGQKARSGPGLRIVFEGGQMPITRRLPKRGFSNARFKKEYEIVNIGFLSTIFENGTVITPTLLIARGVISSGNAIKVLAKGDIDKQFTVHAHKFSKSAEEAIKKQGGEVRFIKER